MGLIIFVVWVLTDYRGHATASKTATTP